ncbi:MAG: DegT/DnrJ/EryC1/StrS family aminotransferase [Algoriphagus sp.]|uniref:DegT/DnrJ/EryC1/StrS family aminotransferase n=1 Tax=Algoriphagus sp. TaxID=1872435 RepID=UPI001849EAAD|nr:DegT/DnrJ/EryC1/StrS family aminotransferase [Algoriphagus sp.]NVJ86744.1 DegT/DnrJ/EryC1/StrS family aminotransferase [Algoriphagus sp.]
MIPVTKPYLPPISEYQEYLEGIWKRQWLTNNGPLVNELELKVSEFLNVPNFLFMSNGTIALQIAIKALGLKGEIITTPFSYVATTSSIVWEGCKPVFVDIDPYTLNIDPKKIEEAISEKTTAILATHVYGNPCDVEAIQKIASKHKLNVIYDGAHGFGVTFKKKSIFCYGDISTVSFHATKLFHTIEGGGVFTENSELNQKMAYQRNFGHDGPEAFQGLGVNGKNSEFHAAMGLVTLKKIEEIISKRKELSIYYDERLEDLGFKKPKISNQVDYNYGYYPIIFPTEEQLLKCVKKLNRSEIYPRRYFYPSLDQLPYVEKGDFPNTDSISRRILCLPLYFELSFEEVDLICRLIKSVWDHG